MLRVNPERTHTQAGVWCHLGPRKLTPGGPGAQTVAVGEPMQVLGTVVTRCPTLLLAAQVMVRVHGWGYKAFCPIPTPPPPG